MYEIGSKKGDGRWKQQDREEERAERGHKTTQLRRRSTEGEEQPNLASKWVRGKWGGKAATATTKKQR
jgi:hypothetical protein